LVIAMWTILVRLLVMAHVLPERLLALGRVSASEEHSDSIAPHRDESTRTHLLADEHHLQRLCELVVLRLGVALRALRDQRGDSIYGKQACCTPIPAVLPRRASVLAQ
jgi:hypothetical protein